MRYTEEVEERESNDWLDIVFSGFSLFVLAPYRIFDEISRKIMYLDREVVEKVLITSAGITMGLLLIDVIYFLLSGQTSVMSGGFPVMSVAVTMIFIGTLTYLWYRRGLTTTSFDSEHVVVETPMASLSNEVIDPPFLVSDRVDTVTPDTPVVQKEIVMSTPVPSAKDRLAALSLAPAPIPVDVPSSMESIFEEPSYIVQNNDFVFDELSSSSEELDFMDIGLDLVSEENDARNKISDLLNRSSLDPSADLSPYKVHLEESTIKRIQASDRLEEENYQ